MHLLPVSYHPCSKINLHWQYLNLIRPIMIHWLKFAFLTYSHCLNLCPSILPLPLPHLQPCLRCFFAVIFFLLPSHTPSLLLLFCYPCSVMASTVFKPLIYQHTEGTFHFVLLSAWDWLNLYMWSPCVFLWLSSDTYWPLCVFQNNN